MSCRFRSKYHPDEYTTRQAEARQTLKHRCNVFMKLLELGWLSNVTADSDHTNELIRILDAGRNCKNMCWTSSNILCSCLPDTSIIF